MGAGTGVGRPTPRWCACRCARLCARAVCAVCSCGLSSAGACSGPCLLRVPVLCVLGPCTFVLVVWCACVAFVHIVRPSPVNVVDITGCAGPCFVLALCMLAFCALEPPMPALRVPAVRTPALRAFVLRACASYARIACTCCACSCCACPRWAPSCWVWCACAALAYIVRRASTSPTPHPSSPLPTSIISRDGCRGSK